MIKRWFGISIAMILWVASLSAFADEASRDRSPPAHNINEYNAPGPDQTSGDSATPKTVLGSRYLFLAGSTFTRFGSTASVSDFGSGCLFTNGALVKDLQLPEDAQIVGARLFYYSDGTPSTFMGFVLLTSTGLGDHDYPFYENVYGGNGYGNELFTPSSPLVVSNQTMFYNLIVQMQPGMRFCGVRIQYVM
ncbi:MAG TPA: hypothetical protein VFN25_05020 [Dokdonella sp.]|uniref:hypothetical protein n=1 Tax=Dokdonella sp. TaxID=2291710 RepID=UPI002D80A1B7|nr:hypothetical protein [Dokdonella sp.]HET9032250.1 hypothetical protein [Dokdonella sp.]